MVVGDAMLYPSPLTSGLGCFSSALCTEIPHLWRG